MGRHAGPPEGETETRAETETESATEVQGEAAPPASVGAASELAPPSGQDAAPAALDAEPPPTAPGLDDDPALSYTITGSPSPEAVAAIAAVLNEQINAELTALGTVPTTDETPSAWMRSVRAPREGVDRAGQRWTDWN